jgi:hypothetical protein
VTGAPGGRYDEPKAVTRAEAERALASSDPAAVASALIAAVLTLDDRAFLEKKISALARHQSPAVRRAAAVAVGHLVRLHADADVGRARALLEELTKDPATAGAAADALDDLEVFGRR